MARRKIAQVYNWLDSRDRPEVVAMQPMQGPYFVLAPTYDAAAWDAIAYYANLIGNGPLKDKLFKWLDEHERPDGGMI